MILNVKYGEIRTSVQRCHKVKDYFSFYRIFPLRTAKTVQSVNVLHIQVTHQEKKVC